MDPVQAQSAALCRGSKEFLTFFATSGACINKLQINFQKNPFFFTETFFFNTIIDAASKVCKSVSECFDADGSKRKSDFQIQHVRVCGAEVVAGVFAFPDECECAIGGP